MRFIPTLAMLCFLAWPALGRSDSEEINQLIQDLGSLRFSVRQHASDRLKEIGVVALPAVQEAAYSADPEVRQRALRLIDGWAAEGKVPALLFQLSSQTEPVRAAAADNLGKLGAAAKDAIPALALATKDPSDVVRCSAREALKTIQATPEVTIEVTALDNAVKVGGLKRYQVEVTNTGTAAATNVRIMALMPQGLTVQGIMGPETQQNGQRIVSVATEVPANAKLHWEVTCKVARNANAPLLVEVRADQLAAPVQGVEGLPAQTGIALPPALQRLVPAPAPPPAPKE
jgi:uncharacterized repeat protein (TIGR01451 family)